MAALGMDPLDAQIRQVYFSVDLSGEQQTKTSTALEFFSRKLEATADASSERVGRHVAGPDLVTDGPVGVAA